MNQLQHKFEVQQERFRKRWLDLSFDEKYIEEDFSQMTWEVHRRYMYFFLAILAFYVVLASIFYNMREIIKLQDQPNITLPTCCNLTNATLYLSHYTRDAQSSRLGTALCYRAGAISALIAQVLAIGFAPRRVALSIVLVFFWVGTFLFDIAIWYENAYDDIAAGFLAPQPRLSLPPLVFIIIVYTSGIPGIPFSIAASCGWGMMVVVFFSHMLTWGAKVAGDFPVTDNYDDHWNVLRAQLVRHPLPDCPHWYCWCPPLGARRRCFCRAACVWPHLVRHSRSSRVAPDVQLRVFLFNLFGSFVGIEQTRQMRLNFWHVRLLQEAVQLHKLCRRRFHSLTANTLPAPIVKAIASGDTGFVKVYDATTVLQADMVGFTPLSSKYSAEVVLGILSDSECKGPRAMGPLPQPNPPPGSCRPRHANPQPPF